MFSCRRRAAAPARSRVFAERGAKKPTARHTSALSNELSRAQRQRCSGPHGVHAGQFTRSCCGMFCLADYAARSGLEFDCCGATRRTGWTEFGPCGIYRKRRPVAGQRDELQDKNYTNGFRYTLDKNYAMWGFGRLARIFGQAPIDCADRSTNAGPDEVCVSTSFHVGQQFYTPDEISESEIISNDRPYAGWAYVGGTWRVSSEVQSAQTDVYVGATGRWSFAEEVQTGWHDKDNLPQGWAHQIDGRFGVIIGHSRRWVPVELDWRKGRWFELVPYIGGTAGTIVDDVYAGLRVKVGWNILLEWLETGIGPRIPTREAGNLEVYGIFDVQGRLVGYNAFLDSKRHEFEREWRIWDYGIGFGLRWKRFSVSYRTVQISPEHSLTGPHDYRAVRVAYRVGR